MTRFSASVIKHAYVADEPFVLLPDAARPGVRVPAAAPMATAATAAATPISIPIPLAPVDPARLRQEGYEEGFDAGLRQGLAEAAGELESSQRECRRQIEEANAARDAWNTQTAKAEASARASDGQVQLLRSVLQALHEARADVLNAAHDDLVALCLGVATQVFEQAALSPEFLLSLTRRAIGELGQSPSFAVHVHPQDLEWMKQGAETLLHGAQALAWVADPAVQLGGCILHTEQAALDARLEQQVDALRQRLLQIRGQRQALSVAPDASPSAISAVSAGDGE